MQMPSRLKIKDLDSTNVEYDAAKLKLYWAMYAGGQFFRDVVDDVIIKRSIEEKPTQIGHRNYAERKKRACYINRTGGFIDWAVAEICKDEPRIEVDGGTPDQQSYWSGLNLNADGFGTPFSAIIRRLLVDEMVSRMSWVGLSQDETDPMQMSFFRINPCEVLDWDRDSNDGTLTFAKVKSSQPYREVDYMPPIGELIQWTIHTTGQSAVYEAIRVNNQYRDANGRSTEFGELVAVEEIDTEIPVHAAQIQRSQWVVDRICDPARQLFNTELDQAFALAEAAYPQMVLTVENRNNIQDIVKSELNCIVLQEGESIEYLLPEKWCFDPMDRQIQNLKNALHETVQLMAKEAASIPQAGRMSGETVKEMRQPVISLLRSYSWPILEVINRVIEQIKDIRREPDLEVKVVGLVDIEEGVEMPNVGEIGTTAEGDLAADTIQETALNGAQVTAATQIVASVANREIPRASGVAQLMLFFQLSKEEAEMVVGEAGTSAFEPAKPEINSVPAVGADQSTEVEDEVEEEEESGDE